MTTHKIKSEDTGRRIDQVVLDMLPNITRSSAKSMLMEGIILINQDQVRPNYKAKEGDSITYDESRVNDFLNKQSHYSIKPVKMDIDVIYEDQNTLVVNKQANLTTHPVPGHREDTLLNGLVYYQTQNNLDGKIRPVHRLDKDTSGVILFAKSRDAHVFYSEQFEKSKVEKAYVAVVRGDFRQILRGSDHIKVQNYLNRSSKEKKMMVEVQSHMGDLAISNIYFDGYWTGLNGTYSRVLVKPKTGRTHQIRVHLAGLGFPILGDPIYSNLKYKRLMLHALSLRLKKFKGEGVEFRSELPKEFTSPSNQSSNL